MKPKKSPKPKKIIHESENFDYMKTNKDNINNVIKNPNVLHIINDLVSRTNKIVIHSYQFLKLYLLYLYDNNISFPIIDKTFIGHIFIVVTRRNDNRGRHSEASMPQQLRDLTTFYNEHYFQTVVENDIVYYDKLSYILPYEAIDMITNIENNIKEHFLDHVNKYVNIVFDVKKQKDIITSENKDLTVRKELHKQLYSEINKIKKDITSFGELTADSKYHTWILEQRKNLYPNKTSFSKDSIQYDLKENVKDYLISMFFISRQLETINNTIIAENAQAGKNEKKQIRLFNVLPLRTNIIIKNICIDTCGLISNFLGDESTTNYLRNYKKGTIQYNLWNRFFKFNKAVFKKNKYTFHFMIKTDGVSCNIVFVRLNNDLKPLEKTNSNKKCSEEVNTEYIENVQLSDNTRNKRVVVADPKHSDLIYCGSYKDNDYTNDIETFRYTQNQRRIETRLSKYQKIQNNIKKTTIIQIREENVNVNVNVIDIETILSHYSSKTCDYTKFLNYLIAKNKANYQLLPHYEQPIFRKLKLNSFINTQKSEAKMITNFKKKFGGPDKTIFVIGDYDKGSYHMKGVEPVICKKFRKLFKNAGYETYLINEFRTSMLCNCCNGVLKNFRKKENGQGLVHGLLCCQTVTQKCKLIHNRDKNAVKNMLNIIKSIYETGKRPAIFTRTITAF